MKRKQDPNDRRHKILRLSYSIFLLGFITLTDIDLIGKVIFIVGVCVIGILHLTRDGEGGGGIDIGF